MSPRRGPDGRGPWARLSAGIIHDIDWLDLDSAGRLCFMTSIALAKASNCDGEFSLRSMVGVQAGALTEKQVRAAAAAITAANLWEHVAGERYRVRSFTRWNESVDEQNERREAKRQGALKTNHKLGRHDGAPESDCPDCRSSDAGANAKANASGGVPAKPTATLDVDSDVDSDVDVDGEPSSSELTPRAAPARADDDPSERIWGAAGIARPGPSQGDRRTVAKALGRGWQLDQLLAKAERAAAAEHDPASYLRASLAECANADPPTERSPLATGNDWGQQWAMLAGGRSIDASETAKRAWHDTRQVRKFEPETTAKFAFRDAYLARVAEVPA